ncbi:hypothetical protein RJ641_017123 [Dillenia turbinata]|uniref:Uncharacterized protein n=1 Tax=Dillenia turbinata TaxID=194707 RepID=A0AAN8UW20_9MAGN
MALLLQRLEVVVVVQVLVILALLSEAPWTAFQNAIFYLDSFSDKGGAQLVIPSGRWLTGRFGLASNLTLWLDEAAVILDSTNAGDWPIIDPLPSYGEGMELPCRRHQSPFYGRNLTDVIITGCHVIFKNVTILAPLDSPNADGIDSGEHRQNLKTLSLSLFAAEYAFCFLPLTLLPHNCCINLRGMKELLYGMMIEPLELYSGE